MQKQWPLADKNVAFTLKRSIRLKQQRNEAQPGKIETTALKGYIEMKDMIRLDKLKKLIFWDFDRADKII